MVSQGTPSRPVRTGIRLGRLARGVLHVAPVRKAIETFRRWRNPPFHMYAELAACYAQLGRIDEAQAAVAKYERQRPEDYNFAKFAAAHIKMCARQEDRDHWLEIYRKAGLPV